jgi:hypothetical protein
LSRFSPRRHGLNPRIIHVGFLAGVEAIWRDFVRVLWSSWPVTFSSPQPSPTPYCNLTNWPRCKTKQTYKHWSRWHWLHISNAFTLINVHSLLKLQPLLLVVILWNLKTSYTTYQFPQSYYLTKIKPLSQIKICGCTNRRMCPSVCVLISCSRVCESFLLPCFISCFSLHFRNATRVSMVCNGL